MFLTAGWDCRRGYAPSSVIQPAWPSSSSSTQEMPLQSVFNALPAQPRRRGEGMGVKASRVLLTAMVMFDCNIWEVMQALWSYPEPASSQEQHHLYEVLQ